MTAVEICITSRERRGLGTESLKFSTREFSLPTLTFHVRSYIILRGIKQCVEIIAHASC